jgi:hypothetical protein
MGDPTGLTETEAPPTQAVEKITFTTFADFDASPTKAWMVNHRNDSSWLQSWQLGFAKRPAGELYDLSKDPDQMHNIAADPAYAAVRRDYSDRLKAILTAAGDPRLADGLIPFEQPPKNPGLPCFPEVGRRAGACGPAAPMHPCPGWMGPVKVSGAGREENQKGGLRGGNAPRPTRASPAS